MSLPEPRRDVDPAPDRAALRAGDADREAVAERLRQAAGDGRLTLDELDERLEAAYTARTYGDLAAVVRDLPADEPVRPDVGEPLKLFAPLNDVKRSGRWRVPPRIEAKTGAGNVKLDFTEAILTSREIFVVAKAIAGNVVLLVPEDWQVRASGSAQDKTTGFPRAGAPTLHVKGSGGGGSVVIRHPRSSRWLPR